MLLLLVACQPDDLTPGSGDPRIDPTPGLRPTPVTPGFESPAPAG
jgi:hypothetical protein